MTEVELITSDLAGHLHDEVMPRLALSLLRTDKLDLSLKAFILDLSSKGFGSDMNAEGPALLSELRTLRSELAQSLERLRRLTAALRRVQKVAQLRAALEASAARGLEAGQGQTPTVSFDLDGATLPPDVTDLVGRIVREGVANAVRHGRARSIRVELRREPGRVRLELQDDGSGFDPAQLKGLARQGHLGLAILRRAVKARGGRLRISSRPGAGTRLLVTLPLPRDQGRCWPAGQEFWPSGPDR